jgi:hypothetical protein
MSILQIQITERIGNRNQVTLSTWLISQDVDRGGLDACCTEGAGKE